MAIAVVGTPQSATATGSAASVSLTKPTGTASGHVILIDAAIVNTSSDVVTATGFTKVTFRVDSATTLSLTRFVRIADGTEGATFSVSASAGGGMSAGVITFSGVDTTGGTSGVWDEAGATTENLATTAGVSLPTLVTATDGAVRVDGFGFKVRSTGALLTNSAGSTEAWDVGNNNATNPVDSALQYLTVSPAGSNTPTVTVGNANNVVISRSLKPLVVSTTKAPPPYQRPWRFWSRARAA